MSEKSRQFRILHDDGDRNHRLGAYLLGAARDRAGPALRFRGGDYIFSIFTDFLIVVYLTIHQCLCPPQI